MNINLLNSLTSLKEKSNQPIEPINLSQPTQRNYTGPNQQIDEPLLTNIEKIQMQIKNKRIALGYSQRELASKIRMSQGTITRAERNGYISLSALLRIAGGLGEEIALIK